jgi:hypothetical protein
MQGTDGFSILEQSLHDWKEAARSLYKRRSPSGLAKVIIGTIPNTRRGLPMKIQVAVAVFLFLSACSVVSMKPTLNTDAKPVAFDGGGGLPTPCIPRTSCPAR